MSTAQHTRLKRQNARYLHALKTITQYQWTCAGMIIGKPRANCFCGACCMVRSALHVLPKRKATR